MQTYNILDYGAIADGVTNCASAIQKAVDEATANGGGRVLIPAGRFLSGTVLLKSTVELHLALGAVLLSSLNEADIQPFPAGEEDDNKDTGWDGGFFLGARNACNVTISGLGVIDGQGDKVFFDNNEDNDFHECPKTCAVFRPRMMLFEAVTNFVVKDVTLKDAAFWTLHMAGCRHVRIQNIMILNDDRGANNDGIDPDCCQDVVVSGCIIRTVDIEHRYNRDTACMPQIGYVNACNTHAALLCLGVIPCELHKKCRDTNTARHTAKIQKTVTALSKLQCRNCTSQITGAELDFSDALAAVLRAQRIDGCT